MTGFLIAVLSGTLMSVQGVFNTQVTKTAGMWVSNGWVQFSAFIICLIAWLVTGRNPVGALMKVEPKYLLLGGVIGAGITWTVIKSMAQLGPAKAALLIVIAQLIVAYVIELMGLFGSGERTICVAQSHRHGNCTYRSCNFSVEIVI